MRSWKRLAGHLMDLVRCPRSVRRELVLRCFLALMLGRIAVDSVVIAALVVGCRVFLGRAFAVLATRLPLKVFLRLLAVVVAVDRQQMVTASMAVKAALGWQPTMTVVVAFDRRQMVPEKIAVDRRQMVMAAVAVMAVLGWQPTMVLVVVVDRRQMVPE